jgi:ribosomal protein S18 acetylase RimI-like enzyme
LRRTGAADALVSPVKIWAAEVGAAQVRLNVVGDNARAKKCYERAGFRATLRQGVVEKNGDIAIEMSCALAPKSSVLGSLSEVGGCDT